MTIDSPLHYPMLPRDRAVAKWLGHVCFVAPGAPPSLNANFLDLGDSLFVYLRDSMAGSAERIEPTTDFEVSWQYYGLTTLSAVPAWRQALHGATLLIPTNPAAAVVLVASGFEAFFLTFMRICWKEAGLQPAAFDNMAGRNPAITGLVNWLPASVGRSVLADAPASLGDRWAQLVNKRRNDVVHRAQVHVTSDEAYESLRTALETVCFFDDKALVRPHVYYTNRDT
ncbi:MAG: hypothetical protein IT360_25470 [Gemmatimonadaceae bacterium]|nr:hypothetical protein [Gemmatimonadaceae bacterium]